LSYSYIGYFNHIQKEHDKRIREIAELEIKNRNRVNISLEEYEKLKKSVNDAETIQFVLQSRIDKLVNIIEKFGVSAEELDNIDISSIVSYRCDDISTNKRRYRLEFDADLRI